MPHSASRDLGAVPGGRSTLGIFLGPDGRLPGFAQRRLDDLIARKKTSGLTSDEERELDEALDYIDAKSAQMLKGATMARAKPGGSSKVSVRK